VYELLFDGDVAADTPQLIGLLDVASLAMVGTTANLTPLNVNFAPQTANLTPISHPENTPFAPTLQGGETARIASADAGSSSLVAALQETPPLGTPRESTPHRRRNGSAALSHELA
nr:hypothetical protein [Pseudomonadota bacterium]